jgi:hypothetical protein
MDAVSQVCEALEATSLRWPFFLTPTTLLFEYKFCIYTYTGDHTRTIDSRIQKSTMQTG